MKVGFVGLGTMGGPMCARLAACGFDVSAYDTDEEARRRTAAPGVATSESISSLSGAGVVVTMLPDGDAVRTALLDRGLVLAPGTVCVDSSSSDPGTTAVTGAELASRGVRFVDAPVSGSPAGAGAGELTLMVGGDDDAVAAALPVLRALGDVRRAGPLGAGHTLKALNNLLSAVNLAAAAEVLLVARRHGLEPAVVLETINASTGRNHATEHKVDQFVFSRTFASGFRLALMHKDIGIAVGLTEAAGVPAPLARACGRLWSEAAAALAPGADNVEVVRWMEQQAGVTLTRPESGHSAGGR